MKDMLNLIQENMHYGGILMRIFLDNNWTIKSLLSYVCFSVVLVTVTYSFFIHKNFDKEYAIAFTIIISMFGHKGLRYANDSMVEGIMKAIYERIIDIIKKE